MSRPQIARTLPSIIPPPIAAAEQAPVPPYTAGLIAFLRTKSHVITWRKNHNGSNRYRIDQGRELRAIEVSNFYERQYGV